MSGIRNEVVGFAPLASLFCGPRMLSSVVVFHVVSSPFVTVEFDIFVAFAVGRFIMINSNVTVIMSVWIVECRRGV